MSADPDPFGGARAVADAVLYEGYVLYPYRASSAKNVTRWQFGVLMPPGYADASERSACRTELVCEARAGAQLDVRVRFLHVVHRTGGDGPEWDETVERQVDLRLAVGDLREGPVEHPFAFAGAEETSDGVRRETAAVAGAVVVALEPLPSPDVGAGRLSVRLENRTAADPPHRDAALRTALVAAHTMLALTRGRFLSMTDHPEWAAGAVAGCGNEGTWPVLVGGESIVLSSPIILGDHPEIAPESPGDLYDATEIDEILTLRTMTLTDAEKAEARATDPRAAALLDRVDNLPPDVLDRLHGALRYLRHATGEEESPKAQEKAEATLDALMQRHDVPLAGSATQPTTPWWDPGADASVDPATDAVVVAGVAVRRGSRVLLQPGGSGRRTDAQDLFLAGRPATVEAVLHDVDGRTHLGVTLDDDEELAELVRWHGRYLYFAPDEIEPLADDLTVRKILVAGVGNIFLSDDAFGVEVVRRFGGRPVPEGVKVSDFGIRGVHLAYELLEGYDLLVLVDAAPRGRPPGTVSLLEVDLAAVGDPGAEVAAGAPLVDAHGLEPGAILRMLGSLGGSVASVFVVACEPESVEEGIGLTATVADAVGPAVELLARVVAEQAGAVSFAEPHPEPHPEQHPEQAQAPPQKEVSR